MNLAEKTRTGLPSTLPGSGPNRFEVAFIAMVYRAAYLIGQPPTATVTAALGLPRSSVGRLIREARDQGLLGPTEERKAGV